MYDDFDTPESEFLDLVEAAPTPEAFHRGAKLMLGGEYRELGEQIVEECRPELMGKFKSYFNADKAPA